MRPARLLSVCGLVFFFASESWAQVICGDNVTTKAVMTADLACGTNPGFTVGAGGSVDMAGHSLTACASCTGITLGGAGAKLSNGLVIASGAGSIGVQLAGGTHKVENVVVNGGETGFSSTSDKNKVKNCGAYGTSDYGFRVQGAKNALSRCHSSTTISNFDITGDNNNLTENTATGGGFGIRVVGNSNKLSRNASGGCSGFGSGAVTVVGNENKLSLNSIDDAGSRGLLVQGNENKVSKTVATNSGTIGIRVLGNLNKLSKNAAYDNSQDGIVIDGDGNNLNGSNVGNNTDVGIRVATGSDMNSLKSNVAMSNGLNGVLVEGGATNSSISKTVALGNADPDLQDDNPNCDGNAWAKSVFGTSEADGVPNHVCIQ